MKLIVDLAQRYAKMRAHTAAHLLHAELVKIFPNTKQAWSFVDEDYLRFDFAADRPLTWKEIIQIQTTINHLIYATLPVETIETSYDEALKLGAKAFFEDKYGDVVRVVKVDQGISTELCGGTHVSNTKDIGCFALLSQEAVASGIKRISAVVGTKVFEQLVEKNIVLDQLGSKLGVGTKQVSDKVEKMMKEYDEMKSMLNTMETNLISDLFWRLESKSSSDIQKIYLLPSHINFKIAVHQAKNLFEHQVVLLVTQEGSFALLWTSSLSAKMLAAKLGLKGGGNDQLVQWKDPKAISLV